MHDLSVTLLEAFGIGKTAAMTGESLTPIIASRQPIKDTALFGYFGAHASITDGRFVYMRGSRTLDNTPLYEYTLMPMRMRRLFNAEELRDAVLYRGLSFTCDMPVFKIPGTAGFYSAYAHGNLLFDLQADHRQEHPLIDPDLEAECIRKLSQALLATQAPADEWLRLGISADRDLINADFVRRERNLSPPGNSPTATGCCSNTDWTRAICTILTCCLSRRRGSALRSFPFQMP
ncbi:hypothetical protein [Martelella alba]|uniref:Uncharacterized protein n=1 Tax=Martelella alba TaxID=2590451 RepID=A0ABY2SJL4_9HYPH|nr:hypothetical protein [Martelella alba]TKI05519.1 hypothetical protein FCN80_14190 [Martelella alba]